VVQGVARTDLDGKIDVWQMGAINKGTRKMKTGKTKACFSFDGCGFHVVFLCGSSTTGFRGNFKTLDDLCSDLRSDGLDLDFPKLSDLLGGSSFTCAA